MINQGTNPQGQQHFSSGKEHTLFPTSDGVGVSHIVDVTNEPHTFVAAGFPDGVEARFLISPDRISWAEWRVHGKPVVLSTQNSLQWVNFPAHYRLQLIVRATGAVYAGVLQPSIRTYAGTTTHNPAWVLVPADAVAAPAPATGGGDVSRYVCAAIRNSNGETFDSVTLLELLQRNSGVVTPFTPPQYLDPNTLQPVVPDTVQFIGLCPISTPLAPSIRVRRFTGPPAQRDFSIANGRNGPDYIYEFLEPEVWIDAGLNSVSAIDIPVGSFTYDLTGMHPPTALPFTGRAQINPAASSTPPVAGATAPWKLIIECNNFVGAPQVNIINANLFQARNFGGTLSPIINLNGVTENVTVTVEGNEVHVTMALYAWSPFNPFTPTYGQIEIVITDQGSFTDSVRVLLFSIGTGPA